ncbi:hypothetical protein [Mycobacterium europaeum]|nr:hypothetical protein [Mycobacterium europaeum]
MTWLEFVSSLVSSLGWPIVVIVVVIYLRSEVKSVAQGFSHRIKDMTKVQAGNVSAEFERGASEVAQRMDAMVSADGMELTTGETDVIQQLPDGTVDDRKDKVERLLEQDPRAVVLLEFIEVESALTNVYQQLFAKPWLPSSRPSFTQMVNTLAEWEIIAGDMAGVMTELAQLRNKIAHEPGATVTEDAARDYVSAAATVIDYLRRVKVEEEKPKLQMRRLERMGRVSGEFSGGGLRE